jgi:hypothetical protein
MPKEIYCKICDATLTKDQLKPHLKEHQSLDPADKKSIFGIR